jgi:predicted RNase H-like HicB family nuclease
MNIRAEFGREEDGRWVAEIPELPGALAYGSTPREAAIAVTVRAFHILADRIESGELKVEDEPGAIILGGTADSLSELLIELKGGHAPKAETIAAIEEFERDGSKSFNSAEELMAESSVAEETDSFAATQLPAPKTLADYYRLRDMLDALIDKIGEDESHPLATFMDRVGTLVEEYENTHLPEIIESKQNR